MGRTTSTSSARMEASACEREKSLYGYGLGVFLVFCVEESYTPLSYLGFFVSPCVQ